MDKLIVYRLKNIKDIPALVCHSIYFETSCQNCKLSTVEEYKEGIESFIMQDKKIITNNQTVINVAMLYALEKKIEFEVHICELNVSIVGDKLTLLEKITFDDLMFSEKKYYDINADILERLNNIRLELL